LMSLSASSWVMACPAKTLSLHEIIKSVSLVNDFSVLNPLIKIILTVNLV